MNELIMNELIIIGIAITLVFVVAFAFICIAIWRNEAKKQLDKTKLKK